MEPAPPPEPSFLRPTGTGGARPDLAGLTVDELRVVAAIATLAPALSPSAPARERMRARVLAGLTADAPTVRLDEPAVGPGATDGDDAVTGSDGADELAVRRHRGHGARGHGARGHGARGRFLVAAAAALCLVVALSGISLVLSRDALPGDALYSLKRAGETTELQLTFGDADRGLRHLDYAARRVDELSALVDRTGSTALGGTGGVSLLAVEQVDPATASALLDALDAQSTAGSGLLTAVGVAGDPTALGSLSTWAQGQSARLSALRPQLPGTSQPRLDSSVGVLEQVRGRAGALASRLSCSPITTGSSDDLGPLPATTACTAPVGPTSTDVTAPATTGAAPSGVAAADPAAPSAPRSSGAPTGPGATGSTSGRGPSGAASGGPGSGGSGATTGPAVPGAPGLPAAPAPPLPTGGVGVPVAPLPTPPPVTIPLLPIPPVTLGPILPGLPPITLGR